MRVKLEIFLNNKKVNEFNFLGEKAKLEFINLLVLTIKKEYKTKIKFDRIRREAKGEFSFLHELANGETNFYKYKYLFYNITENIDL